jgi:hypothetical protein
MQLRLKAFGAHLLGSATVLSLVLGLLYLGWYHWPGWYLSDVAKVVGIMTVVDLALGPLLTFVIASPTKPRSELKRDIGVIIALQLVALGYGTVQLWNGRPLYYAFSENILQVVQAYDLEPVELALAEQSKAPLRPHWYSLPRWIWAPLPKDAETAAKIAQGAINGGYDVIGMPRYYQPWAAGIPDLRKQLNKLEYSNFFSKAQKELLVKRMAAAGFATDLPDTIPLTGRAHPLLAVFDPKTMELREIFSGT